MKNLSIRPNVQSRGSALLIVLAFLLLLTTLTVAFLSRATFERQLSNASFSQGKVDLAGQGAISTIIGDLQQEILAGSNGTGTPALASGYYYPSAPATIIPYTVGFTHATPPMVDGLENLLKISYPSAFYSGSNYNTGTYPAPNRASSVATTAASLNNRSVSAVRWNQPLLLARATPTSTTDYTPVAAFVVPDWIYIARDGSNPGNGTISAWDSSYIYSSSVSPTATPTAGTLGTNPISQRYAYAIYDEGSTLDMNVAGSPSYLYTGVSYGVAQPYKNALAYADLTQLPYLSTTGQTVAGGTSTTLTAAEQATLINAIVGWRNYASAKVTAGAFPGVPTAYTFNNVATAPTTLEPFDLNTLFNAGGYLTGGGFNAGGFSSLNASGLLKGTNQQGALNQSDNAFGSRQQLLQFILQGLGQNTSFTGNVSLTTLVNVLPYLGTFSRDISQPSYASPVSFASSTAPTLSNNTGTGGNSVSTNGSYTSSVDATINPAFLNVTVGSNSGTSGWTRNNGTIAIAGEPLVKKRFALMRLAWLTYKGPSANRNGVATSFSSPPAAGSADYDIYQMENTYGIPQSFLAQGTAQNVYNYFGLSWVSDPNNSGSSEWVYSHTGASASILTSAPSSSTTTAIKTLTSVAGLSSTLAREPDFFELLKAGLGVGSIGKAYTASYILNQTSPNITPQLSPADYYGMRDQDVDNQIIQIGANIISQYQPSGYPARILFNDGLFNNEPNKQFFSSIIEHRGVVDLPYIYGVQESKIRTVTGTYPASNPAYTSCPVSGSPSTYGAGVDLQVPVIWNPHAWTSTSDNSDGNPRPTSFRIYADTHEPTDPTDSSSTSATPSISLYMSWSSGDGVDIYHSSSDASTTPLTPTVPQALSAANSTMTFSIPQSDNYLFREPTLLNKPGIPTLSNLAISGAGNFIKTLFGAGATYITSFDSSPYYSQVSVSPADNQQYIGIVLGGTTLPLIWKQSTIAVGALDGTNPTTAGGPYTVPAEFVSINGGTYITYRLQYYDGTNWITYDEKYAPIVCAQDYGAWKAASGGWGWTFSSTNSEIISNELGVGCFDPRTSRWGMNYEGQNGSRPAADLKWAVGAGSATAGANPGWAAPVNGTAQNATYAAEQNAIWSARPDEYQGFILSVASGNTGTLTGPVAAGWYPAAPNTTTQSGYTTAAIRPGLTCQNNLAVFPASSAATMPRYTGDGLPTRAALPFGVGCYADPDGVVRRGMAAYVPPTATAGLAASQSAASASTAAASGIPFKPAYTFPTANSATLTPTSELASRPIMLNRPFRSVADIGHVFSDTPWRNLDFSTPESGNPGLLDIFCINDTNDPNGLVAGKVNLNTRQAPVLQAILAGAYKDEFGTGTVPVLPGTSGTASVATANVIATGLVSRTTGGTNLVNIGDLVGKWSPPSLSPNGVFNGNATSPNWIDGSQSYAGFSGTSATTSTPSSSPQNLSSLLYTDVTTNGTVAAYDTNNVNRMREVAIRALANSGTTRVWNLMIDVIAQTGRFPSSASSLANFNVEGERRYWVHVAIDRYTGKVLDEQIEEVKE